MQFHSDNANMTTAQGIFRTRLRQWGAKLMLGMATLVLLTGCPKSPPDEPPPALLAPVITIQPSDAQVVVGADARFEATAQGAAITWTWQRSSNNGTTWVVAGTPVTSTSGNSSTAFLNVTGVNLTADNSRYRAVASNPGGQVTSSAATLTVRSTVTPASISVQPAAQQAAEGGTVTFAVTADGTALQYQWQSSLSGSAWANVSGATAPTLQLQGLLLNANGTQYRVVVSNSNNTVTSNPANLTVTAVAAAPAFTLQPTATAVTAPNTATFTVAASGQPVPTLQWQRSSNAGASFTDLPGATGASYTTPATALADNGVQFRAVATSSAGTATSLPATLTVGAGLSLPVFTTQPQDVNLTVGQTASWTAAVSGVPTPTFQWQLSTDGGISFGNINGATGSSYGLVTVAGDNGRRYRVVASNSQGTATSRAAVLAVAGPASVLAGRGWLAGARLNRTSDSVVDRLVSAQIIDKAGRVHVLYNSISSNGSWEVLVSTNVPGAPGAQPATNAPAVLASGPEVLINARRTAPFLVDGLWQSASGNAIATWKELLPCAADPTEACFRNWQSTYNAANAAWGAATSVSDQELAVTKGLFNDTGDRVALLGDALSPTGVNLGWRQSGRSDIERLALGSPGDLFGNIAIALAKVALGNDGAVVVAYVKSGTDGAANLVVRRGSIRNGSLGAEELLESRSAPATINGFWSNTAGQVVLMWFQDNGTRVTQYASTLNSATGGWATTDLGARSTTDVYALGTLTSSGDFYAYSPSTCRTLRRVNGTWLSATALPSALCATRAQWAMDGNGNLLTVDPIDGRWASFDASSQSFVQPFVSTTPTTGAGFVLGTRWNSLNGILLLSDTGIGAFVTVNSFDVLPTASAPNGDSRGPAFKNFWNIYFK